VRILLVNTNRKHDLLAAPPLGLCYVAQAADAAGHQVTVLDLCFAPGNIRTTLKQAVDSVKPEIVGLSVRNVDNVNMLHPVSYLPEIIAIKDQIRSLTTVPVVIGGPGASLMPRNIMKLLGADYIVVSDGEESFVKLLGCLENGNSPAGIPGVGMMVDGRFHLTRPLLTKFSSGTCELGRWIDITPYQRIGSSYNVQTKRGCRQRCIYCTYNQSIEGNSLRLRSPVEVVDEIEMALAKFHPKTFEFVDSVFNDPLEHTTALLEEILRRPWKAEFTAMGVHPRNLDQAFLDLMWRAGFRSFMITPDSASNRMLHNYGKGFTKDDVVRSAEVINQTSFAAWWFFMIGGPGETNKSLQESLDFALRYLQKNGRAVTHIAHFFTGVRVYPGTRLWDTAMAEGLLNGDIDPLEQLWYVSEDLDLELAVNQMTEAASQCPEIFLGFDERILSFSRVAAPIFKLLHLPKPYWRYFRAANRFGLSTGIRFMYRPPDIAGMIRSALKRQGYAGRLLHTSAR
jgi:radical SAM superfamily enzyme YgiQ (UPF0313 family)